jgi:hypothetical protein
MDHSPAGSRWSWPFLVMAMALLGTACSTQGLAFVQDKRVDIVAPEGHSTVDVPVTITWTVHDFHITGQDGRSRPQAGYFGLFVDRAPVPPGKPLSWLAHGDDLCVATPGCPDKQYLADHDTYAVTGTSFTLRQLPDLDAYHGHELHEVTIVMLDGEGLRVGEQAWFVDFRYDREGL